MAKKTIVIGGSKGLGRDIVRKCLMQRRDDIVYMCRSKNEEFEKSTHITYRKLDLDSESSLIAATVAEAANHLGGLDNLIIASGMGAYHPILVSDNTVKELFQINVFGPMSVYREAFKWLIKSDGERKVIMITSTCARRPGSGGLSYYAATKAAINGWIISESRRAAKAGIALCAVAPGFFESEMVKDLKPELRDKVTKAIPFGRFGESAEVADFVISLLSQTNWTLAGNIYECSGAA